jgi:hypothetical protein
LQWCWFDEFRVGGVGCGGDFGSGFEGFGAGCVGGFGNGYCGCGGGGFVAVDVVMVVVEVVVKVMFVMVLFGVFVCMLVVSLWW